MKEIDKLKKAEEFRMCDPIYVVRTHQQTQEPLFEVTSIESMKWTTLSNGHKVLEIGIKNNGVVRIAKNQTGFKESNLFIYKPHAVKKFKKLLADYAAALDTRITLATEKLAVVKKDIASLEL